MAKCRTCSRTRCVCNRVFDVAASLGPAEAHPGLPGVPAYGAGIRPRPYKPGEQGLLSRAHHKGCLNGCPLCQRSTVDPRLAYARRLVDSEGYNKFASVDDGVSEDILD